MILEKRISKTEKDLIDYADLVIEFFIEKEEKMNLFCALK